MKKKKDAKNDEYTVKISCFGQSVIGTGTDVVSIMKRLELRNVRGRAIMTVTHGDVTREKILMPQVVMRAFNTAGYTRDICIRNLASLFSGI